jgi:hypothetical protein
MWFMMCVCVCRMVPDDVFSVVDTKTQQKIENI